MRQFYVGNINLLSYSNKIGEKITLIRENVPLYKTRTQRWVKVEDGTPPNTEEEAKRIRKRYKEKSRKKQLINF